MFTWMWGAAGLSSLDKPGKLIWVTASFLSKVSGKLGIVGWLERLEKTSVPSFEKNPQN